MQCISCNFLRKRENGEEIYTHSHVSRVYVKAAPLKIILKMCNMGILNWYNNNRRSRLKLPFQYYIIAVVVSNWGVGWMNGVLTHFYYVILFR